MPTAAGPVLPVVLKHATKRKSASAQIREGAIEVTLPKHWLPSFQKKVTQDLCDRLQRQFQTDWQLVQKDQGPLISFDNPQRLTDWVTQLNQETLQVPLNGVRIGSSKYSRLAQMNTKTCWMTISRYCLDRVPESALRYLVIHELAHLKVPNHSPAFWSEVKAFVPHLRHQRRLIAAIHRIRLYEEATQSRLCLSQPPIEPPPSLSFKKPTPKPQKKKSLFRQLFLFGFD